MICAPAAEALALVVAAAGSTRSPGLQAGDHRQGDRQGDGAAGPVSTTPDLFEECIWDPDIDPDKYKYKYPRTPGRGGGGGGGGGASPAPAPRFVRTCPTVGEPQPRRGTHVRERRAARGFRRGRHAKHVSDTLHGPRNPGVPGGSPAPALRVELRLKELSKSCAINEGGLKAPAPISSRLSSLLGAKTTGRTVWNNFPSQTEPPRRGVPDRARCLISGACAVQGTLSVGARGLRIRHQAPPWR